MLQLIFSTFFSHSRAELETMFPLSLCMRCNDRHMYANTFSHSQTINHYITYSVISSEPALTYTSVVSTIRCYAITSGDLEGSTYVEYTGNFSSDADAGKSCIFRITRLIGTTILTPHLPHRCHPGRQVQAPRGPRRPRQGRLQAVDYPSRSRCHGYLKTDPEKMNKIRG